MFIRQKAFKDKREDIQDKQRSGSPSNRQNSHNGAKMQVLLVFDRLVSILMNAEMLRFTKPIVYQTVVENLQMWKICDKLIDSSRGPVPDKTQHHNISPVPVQPQYVTA